MEHDRERSRCPGTPSIGYRVSGLVDSVAMSGGHLVDESAGALAAALEDFFAGDLQLQPRISTKPWTRWVTRWKQPCWSKLVSDLKPSDHPPTSPQLGDRSRLQRGGDDCRGRAASRCRAGGAAASYEVIVVSDGSTDGTPEIVRQLGLPAVDVVAYPDNRKGSAIMAGAEAARRIVGFIDGDLDIHPSGLVKPVDQLETTGVDAAVASKVHPDSVVRYPAFRRFQSRLPADRPDPVLARRCRYPDRSQGVPRRSPPGVSAEGHDARLRLRPRAARPDQRRRSHRGGGAGRADYQFSTTTGTAAVLTTLWEVGRIYRTRRTRQETPPRTPAPASH